MNNKHVTSEFQANRGDVANDFSHLACDYTGDNVIRAFYRGKVYNVGYYDGVGYYIIIQHNINGKTVYNRYQHLARQDASIGDIVLQVNKLV